MARVRPVGELGEEAEPVAVAVDSRMPPVGGRLLLVLGLALLAWTMPLFVFYLLW